MSKKKKKKYYKPKFKGIRYIAKSLNKYFKKKYPTYYAALPKANEILDKLKAEKKEVRLEYIFDYLRKKQQAPYKGKRKRQKEDIPEKPELDEDLSSPQHWFMLPDYPNWISNRSPKELFFKSNISEEGLPYLQGGTLFEEGDVYDIYFRDFVNYINSLKALTSAELKMYEEEWYIMCTDPEYSEEEKIWISTIISVDQDGDPNGYGFDPKEPSKRAGLQGEIDFTKEEEAKKPKKGEEEEKPSEKSKLKGDQEFQLRKMELEKEILFEKNKTKMLEIEEIKARDKERRNKIIEDAYKQALQGKITWERYDKIVGDLG